jgi:hypothetical protein
VDAYSAIGVDSVSFGCRQYRVGVSICVQVRKGGILYTFYVLASGDVDTGPRGRGFPQQRAGIKIELQFGAFFPAAYHIRIAVPVDISQVYTIRPGSSVVDHTSFKTDVLRGWIVWTVKFEHRIAAARQDQSEE